MLIIELSQIPPEGTEFDRQLDPGEVHVEGEDSFVLEPGGTLRSRVDLGDEGSVHVQGRLEARLGVECARCLEKFSFPVGQELDLFYLPRREQRSGAEEEDEVELKDRDMVVAFYRGDRLDLGEAVREQLFLALPMKRLCRPDCRGLCPSCGTNRNAGECGCAPEPDPRLASLARLFDKGSQ
jgi:uncharacterized protein